MTVPSSSNIYISSYFHTDPCLEPFKFQFNRITHDCLSHYSCNYPFPVNHYYNTLGHLSYTIYQMGWVTLSHSHKNIFPRPSLSNLFKHFVLCIMKLYFRETANISPFLIQHFNYRYLSTPLYKKCPIYPIIRALFSYDALWRIDFPTSRHIESNSGLCLNNNPT